MTADSQTDPGRQALPRPIATGRSAQIYPWESDKVLKLFLDTIPADEIEREYQNTLAAVDSGACPMGCHGKTRVLDRTGIILDRIDGISLTRTPEKNPLCFFTLPTRLADLHLALHQKENRTLPDVRDLAVAMLDRPPLSFLSEEEKAAAGERVMALPQGDTVLHMDFHPENVLVQGETCIPIDWMTAARGVPAADVASTRFLMNDAELFPGISPLKKAFYEVVRRLILGRYLKRYLGCSGMTQAEIRAWRLPVLLLRLGLWDIDSERERLKAEIRALVPGEGR